MKTITVTITLDLVFLGVLIGALRYRDYTENPRSSFVPFAEMEAAGMVSSGWLPEFLSKSATHAEESHNIDAMIERGSPSSIKLTTCNRSKVHIRKWLKIIADVHIIIQFHSKQP